MPRRPGKRRPGRYRANIRDRYNEIPATDVPAGINWRPPQKEHNHAGFTVLQSIGGYYRLERDRETGQVRYFKRKDFDEADKKSPAESIDIEDVKPNAGVNFRAGTFCWYIDEGYWFCVEIVERTKYHAVLRPTTGWDADRVRQWPHGDAFKVVVAGSDYLPNRDKMRPLKARKP